MDCAAKATWAEHFQHTLHINSISSFSMADIHKAAQHGQCSSQTKSTMNRRNRTGWGDRKKEPAAAQHFFKSIYIYIYQPAKQTKQNKTKTTNDMVRFVATPNASQMRARQRGARTSAAYCKHLCIPLERHTFQWRQSATGQASLPRAQSFNNCTSRPPIPASPTGT